MCGQGDSSTRRHDGVNGEGEKGIRVIVNRIGVVIDREENILLFQWSGMDSGAWQRGSTFGIGRSH
jgi:hypothetical protein